MNHMYFAVARYADTTDYDYIWLVAPTYWQAMKTAMDIAKEHYLYLDSFKDEYTLYTFFFEEGQKKVIDTIDEALATRGNVSYFSDLDDVLLELAENNQLLSWELFK